MSDSTIFHHANDKMFYYVREPCYNPNGERGEFEGSAEGFAHSLEFISELIEGRVSIDGLHSHDIGLGDTFRVSSSPEYRLKGVKFIV